MYTSTCIHIYIQYFFPYMTGLFTNCKPFLLPDFLLYSEKQQQKTPQEFPSSSESLSLLIISRAYKHR